MSVFRFLFLTGIALGLCVTLCAAASPLRVAVFAPEDSDAAALVAAEVSKLPDVEVVERGQIKLLLGEQGLGDASRERLALGRILAADFLLLVEPKQNAFAWIDATTGEELARIRKNSEKELAQSAVALVGKGREATAATSFTASVWEDAATKLAGDAHPWARFADAHNLVLVVPQFFQLHASWNSDHPCSAYQFANIWAGQALLDRILSVGKLRTLNDRKILFSSYHRSTPELQALSEKFLAAQLQTTEK